MRPDLVNNLQLAAMLARLAPHQSSRKVADDAATIIKTARSLAALSLADCNRGLTQRQEARRETLVKRCGHLVADYGLTAHCYGDPRGYVVRLNGEGVVQNSFGDGFGVA